MPVLCKVIFFTDVCLHFGGGGGVLTFQVMGGGTYHPAEGDTYLPADPEGGTYLPADGVSILA